MWLLAIPAVLLLSLTKRRAANVSTRRTCIVSRRTVSRTPRDTDAIPNDTEPGFVARNEMDTHADTCCAGANWSLMEYTGEVCEVSPFLSSYDPTQEIPVARCCTVWTSEETGEEYLLVADQMLWFGTTLQNSLINPNQVREYGWIVDDNPFTSGFYGIAGEELSIPFETSGTIVHFESRRPTEWEKVHLPVILLTAEDWDPANVELRSGSRTREDAEMRTVKSLTSGMSKHEVMSVRMNAANSQQV